MQLLFFKQALGAKYAELRGLASSLQERSRDLKNQLSTERKAFFDVMGNNALFTVHSDLTDGLIIEDILAPEAAFLQPWGSVFLPPMMRRGVLSSRTIRLR